MKLWKKQGKSTIQKMGQSEPPLKIFLFLKMKFCYFFLIPMDQKYQNESHHHDCVTSGQYVLFQHPIILSLDYDGPIWNSKVKYMDFEKLKK